VRSIIGLAGQYAAVDPNLTGAENLRLIGRLVHMDRRQVGPRAVELLERFALEHAGNRPVRTYSGGMRRRLDLAAALVHRPPVLFLDEPTTGLDIQGRQELWSVIQQLVNDGTTVLLTTQYLEEADRLAQRIAVIDGGRVIANDTPSVLKARLGATVIELGFAAEPEARRAHERVGGLGLHAERTGTTLRVTSNEGPRLLVDVLRSLDDQLDGQLEPAHVAVREPTLDDVFLSLTGHHAEPQQPEEPEREQEQQPDRETEQEWAS
jgi:ABC-type multidrug transport system ATPase subunit